MATLTTIRYYHPKHSLEMLLKDIPHTLGNTHIGYAIGDEPDLLSPVRARFDFDKIVMPSFRGAELANDYKDASPDLRAEIKIPLEIINTPHVINVGLFSFCQRAYRGLKSEDAIKLGFKYGERLSDDQYFHLLRYSHHVKQPQSPIRNAFFEFLDSHPNANQQDAIRFLQKLVGNRDLMVMAKTVAAPVSYGNFNVYKALLYFEYYFAERDIDIIAKYH